MESGIYQIRNIINNKRYIGSASNIQKRWQLHLLSLRGNYHYNKYFQNVWNKYGEENFRFEVLYYCRKEELLDEEQKRIDYYETAKGNGYNLCLIAGSQLGMKQTSAAKLKNKLSHLGRRHSEETKKKIGISSYGRRHSEETKRKMGEVHIGNVYFLNKHHSEETKRKISLANKGKPSLRKGTLVSKETKIKMCNSKKGVNNPMYGRKHSEETKIKMSLYQKKPRGIKKMVL